MTKRWVVVAAVAAAVAVAGAPVGAANDIEQPAYAVLDRDEAVEIRQYAPMIIATTTVSGSGPEARSRGFRILADYIFGNNTAADEIAMTSPVTQRQTGEEIAMTSPVTQQGGDGTWEVSFVMPAQYTIESLPVPVNPAVSVNAVPARKLAAIRFAGGGRTEDLQRYEAELRGYLAASGQAADGAASYAFYDGPWVPAPLRRNEVLVEIE